MVDEILFDSGQATLKPAGVEVLHRVGAVLKKAENRLIIVQGHTDNVPIVGRLAERFPTNWELSAARAVNVVRFLQEEVGLDPTWLSASSFSEYQPRSDNSTEEGRQKNRRIEILLSPLPEVEEAPEEQS
jgi:chemotaxis protein MotB